jgi:hypothetical protein
LAQGVTTIRIVGSSRGTRVLVGYGGPRSLVPVLDHVSRAIVDHARGAIVDAGEWEEGKHPRVKTGPHAGEFAKGGGGGGTSTASGVSHEYLGKMAKAAPEPSKYAGAAGKKLQWMLQKALEQGNDPHAVAEALKSFAAGYKHHAVAVYANHALNHLALAHGISAKTLGKAQKAPATPKAAPAPAPAPPPKQEAPKETEPPVAAPESTEELENEAINEWIKGLEAKPAAGPQPHEGSEPQKKIYGIATDPNESAASKIAAIQQIAQTAYKGGFTEKFANEWIKALGGEPTAPAAPPAPPKPPGQTYRPPENSPQLKRALALEKTATRVPNVHTPESKKITPSLESSWWDKNARPAERNAVRHYTGKGYRAMNEALRGLGTPDPKTLKQIHDIDELFHHEEAKTTEDVVMYRGETVPPEVIEKYVKLLQAGLTARYSQQGFISCSQASHPAFGKNTTFEIVVRKGTPALGVHVLSPHKHENEVLLRHGQAFEVYEVRQYGGMNHIKMVSIL